MKKMCVSVILLQMCTINEDHMIYDSWNIRCNKQTFLSFWDIFCPFTPWQPGKSKFWEIKNIPGDIIILHMCTINDNHMCLVPEIWSTIDKFFVILDHFLPSYPTNNPKNKYFEKMKKKKKHLEILSCYKGVP